MDALYSIILSPVRAPSLRLRGIDTEWRPSSMTVLAGLLLSYFLVTAGIIYGIVLFSQCIKNLLWCQQYIYFMWLGVASVSHEIDHFNRFFIQSICESTWLLTQNELLFFYLTDKIHQFYFQFILLTQYSDFSFAVKFHCHAIFFFDRYDY